MTTAMRRCQFALLPGVHVMLLPAAAASTLAVPLWVYATVTGAMMLAGIGLLLTRSLLLLRIVAYYAPVSFAYVVADSPDDLLIGVLIPLTSWIAVLPIMLRLSIATVVESVILTGALAAVMLLVHPEWGTDPLKNLMVRNLILTIAAILLRHSLRRIAEKIDRGRHATLIEQRRAVRARALYETTAEYVRVLHDTIVNTFGALAREPDERTDPALIRDRCRRDLDRIRAFQSAHSGRSDTTSLTDLESVGLPINWSGIVGDDLRRLQALLPARVLHALHGCAAEAILNATKHSGAGHVVCHVAYADSILRVDISDDGVGFDRARVVENGIAHSIFARAAAHEIDAELESVPGRGTRVSLSYRLDRQVRDSAPAGDEAAAMIRGFEVRMATSWALTITFIVVGVEVFSDARFTAPRVALLLILVGFTAVQFALDLTGRARPGRLLLPLLVAVPIVSWCALASVDYGRETPYLFQVLGMTVLPILLYMQLPIRRAFPIAVTWHVAWIVAISMMVTHHDDPALWVRILLLKTPAVCLLTIYYLFIRAFRRFGSELVDAQRELERATHDSIALETAADVQLRWSASSLKSPLRLLEDIADGTISATDPATRDRCGDEEALLREITSMTHEATLLSRWLALALAESRVRSVNLRLQAAGAQVTEVEHADALGRLMLDCVTGSAPDADLTISILQQGGAPRMLIVGDDPRLVGRAQGHDGDRLTVTSEELSERILIEATLAG